ncbi:MAG: hypothetical protein K2H21_08125 [Muribaculaceae bacterium]|nr:hypothetical protein [Muribaculaceae bacterium]
MGDILKIKGIDMYELKELKDSDSRIINRKVVDIVLLIICWSTISPLMLLINRDEKYMKKWVMWLAIAASPFTFNVLAVLMFPIIGISLFVDLLKDSGYVVNLSSFPELTQFSDNNMVLFAELVALPVYAVCVVILFVVMMFTGWNYREASVYVCEYFEPWACVFVALAVAIIILSKFAKMDKCGKLLSLLPLTVEVYMAWNSIQTYFERKATYSGMGIDTIFNYVVDYLMQMAESSQTNYILANMYVYILPMMTILLTGLAARFIYRRRRI